MISVYFQEKFQNSSLALLGFGKEGKSTYQVLRRYLPRKTLLIADSNSACPQEFADQFGEDPLVEFCCGQNCLDALQNVDYIIKSPGVSLKTLGDTISPDRIISQTSIFLDLFRSQVIGITGTKGKSTTTSLLYSILKEAGLPVVMGGNIGIPPLELIDRMDAQTLVVFEMSSHQLETLTVSPAVAILLNIFQEHLDHYNSYRDYQLAKYNIALWQQPGDYFIYNATNPVVASLVEELGCKSTRLAVHGISDEGFGARCLQEHMHLDMGSQSFVIENLCSNRKLPGDHNITNILAASAAAFLKGAPGPAIASAVASFSGLPHRLEFVGKRGGALFYNDSISTIPESTIEALRTFPHVNTLLLGGYDRGVDYNVLVEYLWAHPLSCVIFMGKAGQRMMELYEAGKQATSGNHFYFADFESAVQKAFEATPEGGLCLLSPAAASYDMFRNFEHRGEKFRQMVLENS